VPLGVEAGGDGPQRQAAGPQFGQHRGQVGVGGVGPHAGRLASTACPPGPGLGGEAGGVGAGGAEFAAAGLVGGQGRLGALADAPALVLGDGGQDGDGARVAAE
jgi:hypothetical protein